ncbi:MAG: hypothetical protein Q4D51_06545 [Eubacteriales bacterium]|nr:hypothetical protein [Eubacteriales bacterium]
MKITDKKKPVSTIPDGVWESSRPNEDEHQERMQMKASTDLQGNGYPEKTKNADSEM